MVSILEEMVVQLKDIFILVGPREKINGVYQCRNLCKGDQSCKYEHLGECTLYNFFKRNGKVDRQ